VNGATFKITGDPTTYRVTGGDTTVAANTLNLTIFPALRKAATNGTVVAFDIRSASEEVDNYQTLAFHKNALGLAMISLPTDLPGQDVSALSDSGYALRVRRWSDGRTGESALTYDSAWGVAVLDGQLCVRVIRPLV
jgi:hypothetical protein